MTDFLGKDFPVLAVETIGEGLTSYWIEAPDIGLGPVDTVDFGKKRDIQGVRCLRGPALREQDVDPGASRRIAARAGRPVRHSPVRHA